MSLISNFNGPERLRCCSSTFEYYVNYLQIIFKKYSFHIFPVKVLINTEITYVSSNHCHPPFVSQITVTVEKNTFLVRNGHFSVDLRVAG